MYRLMALLLLAACAAAPTTVMVGRYRPAEAAIYSSAVLDPARLAGRWQQVAGFGSTGCPPGVVEISRSSNGLQISYQLCQAGGVAQGKGVMQPDGPGRFVVPGQPGPWWVLWADGDYRTLVIGSPNGRLGFILNRGAISADRLVAAREILDWNGYDLRQLRVY